MNWKIKSVLKGNGLLDIMKKAVVINHKTRTVGATFGDEKRNKESEKALKEEMEIL